MESPLFHLDLLTGLQPRRRSLWRGSVVECGGPLPLSTVAGLFQSARGLARSKTWRYFLGRAGGPLHFRLLIMPLVVTTLAVRAGLKDAREGQPAFLWAVLTNPAERGRLLRSGLKDVGGIFIVALVLDTTYQLMVLRAFYVVQLLIVAVACAIVPYVVIRGPVTRLTRGLYRNQAAPANLAAARQRKISPNILRIP